MCSSSTESRFLATECEPSALPSRVDQAELDCAVVARGVGIGADLMRLLDQRFRLTPGNAGQRDVEGDLKAKAALSARPESDRGHPLRICRDLGRALRGQQLHGAEKAGRVAGSEKLLGIIAIILASEFLRPGEFYLEPAVRRPRIAFAAADSDGACCVDNVHRH